MSALTDLFTSMANKIRSKVGGSQTYTPLQMVSAIDDVYDAGAASVPSPTSITPSNASPASMTSGNAYQPTANGYAIESYSSVTPSDSSPASVSANEIIKSTASGYLYATQHKRGAYGTISSVVGNKVTETVNTGLNSIDQFVLKCKGHSSNAIYAVVLYDKNTSTTETECYYTASNSGSRAMEPFGDHLNTWVPNIKSISGGTIVLETGANAASAIKEAWWGAVGN